MSTVSALSSSACGRSEKTTVSELKRTASRPQVPVPSAPVPSAPPPSQAVSEPTVIPEGLREISGSALRKRIEVSSAQATLVNIWASWCGPCKREFPMLVGLRENLTEQGVDVVFVSVDEAKTYPEALSFAEQNGLAPPLWIYEPPLGRFKRELHQDWPGMLPATFLFDESGQLRYFWGGPVYDHEILPVIEGLLRGEKIDGETRYGLKKGVDYRKP